MRRYVSKGATAIAVSLLLAGCQLVNGSYSLESDAGSESACLAVALCCGSLSGTEASSCETLAALQDDKACATFIQTTCLVIKLPDGSVGGHDTGLTTGPDVGTQGGGDTSTASDPLDGQWRLTDIQCNGGSLGTGGGTTSITFSGAAAVEVTTLADGCTITTTLSSLDVTSSTITAASDVATCSTECTSTDCTPYNGTFDEPYSVDGTTLDIRDSVATTTCSSGTLTFVWTKQ